MYGDRKLKVAVVSGLKNAGDLIERIKAGEHYDLVEVMACPGGCINGGGQPFVQSEEREKRARGCTVRINSAISNLLKKILL